MQRHTHREYLLWNEYLDEQWEKPDRHDHYLMQIAMYVSRQFGSSSGKLKLSSFKLPFVWRKAEAVPIKTEAEEAKAKSAESAKSRWFGFLGMTNKDK
jgi:hypothetical protein